MKHLLLAICLLCCGVAQAARIPVSLTTPSTNKDGSVLTNLSSVEIEWGTCNGLAFGTYKGGALIATTQVGVRLSTFIYPTGLTKVCIRAFAYNANGGKSDSSIVVIKDLLPTTGKPVTLDQPVILNFKEH